MGKKQLTALVICFLILCSMVYAQVRERYIFPQSDVVYRVYELVFDEDDFDFSSTNIVLIPAKDPNKVPYYDPNGNPTTDPNLYYDPNNSTLHAPAIDTNSLEIEIDVNSPIYYVSDSNTYITTDGSDNMTFTDAVTGTRTLKNIGCPVYHYIKATAQAEGDLHLSDATNWNVDKALITSIRVVTSSTDWDLWILQNDNGYAVNDATIPMYRRVNEVSGNATLLMNRVYEDEDASKEVHLYYIDNSGVNTADIYIFSTELI